MHVVYAQRLFLPTTTAHAVHTCATVGEALDQGLDVDFFPGGALGPGREHLAGFFRNLGFSGQEAARAVAFPLRSRPLYGLWFRARLALAGSLPGAVFHATSLKEAVMALQAKKALGLRAPVFFEIHHLISQLKGGAEGRRFLDMERRAFAEADAIIFNCRALRDQAAGLLPEPARSLVLPLGFNQRVFFPLPAPAPGAPCRELCYVGTLQAGKGVMNLPELLSLLPDDFRLTVIGGKPADRLQALRRKLDAAGLAGRTTLCGQVPQKTIRELLPAGAIMIIPLHTAEDFLAPMKMYEALGLGLPIAATPMPSLKDFLVADENAVYSRDSSPAALAAAVRRLADNPGRCAAMRAANRTKAAGQTNARRGELLRHIWFDGLK